MTISIFDLFAIGIGPSSSHTVGPMRAANNFISVLSVQHLLFTVSTIKIELYGSLALTGKGHGTDIAILNGLEGKTPQSIEPSTVQTRATEICISGQLCLNNEHTILYIHAEHLLFQCDEILPFHSNGLRFSAYNADDRVVLQTVYYSIGGGFIITDEQAKSSHILEESCVKFPFSTAKELLAHCHDNHLTIAEIMMSNELYWRNANEVRSQLLHIASIMLDCIAAGCQSHKNEFLPGILQVRKRAPLLYNKIKSNPITVDNHNNIMNWLNVYAMAVNEQNAAGERIVTAPTNGAAGIIPAVLQYYLTAYRHNTENSIIEFLLTAGAIAILYKKGASISAAEVGCQGEVGVACSMAAAALTAVLGGTLAQIENAAEIGMEHHLGLTCDPIGGLVQIPCIERNAMGAVQAVNAANLSLLEQGNHKVSLDAVIATMWQTGKDMSVKYKETSTGGLATAYIVLSERIKPKLNQPAC
jgi:L-serine dehydratase